jgi:ribosomal protein L28
MPYGFSWRRCSNPDERFAVKNVNANLLHKRFIIEKNGRRNSLCFSTNGIFL